MQILANDSALPRYFDPPASVLTVLEGVIDRRRSAPDSPALGAAMDPGFGSELPLMQ